MEIKMRGLLQEVSRLLFFSPAPTFAFEPSSFHIPPPGTCTHLSFHVSRRSGQDLAPRVCQWEPRWENPLIRNDEKSFRGERASKSSPRTRFFTSPFPNPCDFDLGIGFVAFPPDQPHSLLLIPRSHSHRSLSRRIGFVLTYPSDLVFSSVIRFTSARRKTLCMTSGASRI